MRSTFLISITFLLLSCIETTFKDAESLPDYNLSKPDVTLTLPDVLKEVSGLTYIDSSSVACIQDENGILFIYDILNNKIKKQHVFNINGDYEGVARVGKTIYVLRSDGALFEIEDCQATDSKLTSYVTGIPVNNNEGLCYDSDKNRLLIACKGKIENDPKYKDKRLIYGFDLKNKKLIKEPVFEFDVQVIKQFAVDNKVKLSGNQKKKGEPAIRFKTSAICIHPLTKKLYLLSAADHLLFVFNAAGKVEHMEPLNPNLFNKAEGLTFFENGDMLVTNEGQNKKPTLLRFNYRKE